MNSSIELIKCSCGTEFLPDSTLPTTVTECPTCDNIHVVVASKPCSYTPLEQDDAGRFIERSFGYSEVFERCNGCEEKIGIGEKAYIAKKSSDKREKTMCKSCRKKETVIEAL